MTSRLQRFMCYLRGDTLPAPTPCDVHPHTLAGYYNEFDHLEELLRHEPYDSDASFAARDETLTLAETVAPMNPTLALRALKMTASSANIYGDHNNPLCRTALQIAQALSPRRPVEAARFAFTSLSLSQGYFANEGKAFEMVCAILPEAAQANPQEAADIACQLPYEVRGLAAQQHVLGVLDIVETRLEAQPALRSRVHESAMHLRQHIGM